MFSQALNTIAKAKLVRNAKHKTLFKLIVAFNVTQTNAKGQLMFPVQKKCDYVSGDLAIEDVATALQQAQKTLRTTNIVIVD